MATATLGTNANNSIPLAMQFQHTGPIADFAALLAAMVDDGVGWEGGPAATRMTYPACAAKVGWGTNGLLVVPNRGMLRVLPGDWVGVDNRGWPILLSADTIASGLWTHS